MGKKITAKGLPKETKEFEDHFSRRANVYVRYRPTYPDVLYSYLASIAPHRRLAWDCGTGNGQAALGLAQHFDRVIATDASADQLAQAPRDNRIEYRKVRAEDSGLPNHSVALTTVAVAVHWFDFERFYAEVRRVTTPGGVIAVWCYSLPLIEPAIDRLVRRFCYDILSGYWPDRFRYIDEQYRTLPFPFKELPSPKFTMETEWNVAELLGFLHSWSGTANYEKQRGNDPTGLIRAELTDAWGARESMRTIHWDLFVRAGNV